MQQFQTLCSGYKYFIVFNKAQVMTVLVARAECPPPHHRLRSLLTAANDRVSFLDQFV